MDEWIILTWTTRACMHASRGPIRAPSIDDSLRPERSWSPWSSSGSSQSFPSMSAQINACCARLMMCPIHLSKLLLIMIKNRTSDTHTWHDVRKHPTGCYALHSKPHSWHALQHHWQMCCWRWYNLTSDWFIISMSHVDNCNNMSMDLPSLRAPFFQFPPRESSQCSCPYVVHPAHKKTSDLHEFSTHYLENGSLYQGILSLLRKSMHQRWNEQVQEHPTLMYKLNGSIIL